MGSKQKAPLNPEARLEAITDIRDRFQGAVADPLRAAMSHRPALQAAALISQIPLEAAAAAFDVHLCQSAEGWHVAFEAVIDSEHTFHVSAQAKSLRAALFQAGNLGLQALSAMESKAVKAIRTAGVDESESPALAVA